MESDTRKLKICMNVKNVRRNAKIAKDVLCLGSGNCCPPQQFWPYAVT